MHLFSKKKGFRIVFLYAALCLTLAAKLSAVSTNLAITNWGEEGTVRCYDTVTDVWNDENGWNQVWCWGCDCRWESSYMWWVKTLEVSGTTNGCPIQVTVGFVYGHQETFNVTGNGGSVYLSFYWQNDDWSQDPVTASANEVCNVAGSVDGADYLGNDGEDDVYATAATGGVVTITASASPEVLEQLVWEGGDEATVGQRTASKTQADVAHQVRAYYGGIKVFGFKIKVYKTNPGSTGPLVILAPITRDDHLVEGGANMGYTQHVVAAGSQQFAVYYENKKFKFVFQNITYPAQWGIDGDGRGDVTDPNANPFPNGKDMPFLTSMHDRKVQAKSDFLGLTYYKYWSSQFVTDHEMFHLHDFPDNFHTPKMLEAKAAIESEEVAATIFNSAESALESKRIHFQNIVIIKTNEAEASYQIGKEARAYAISDPEFIALGNAINP